MGNKKNLQRRKYWLLLAVPVIIGVVTLAPMMRAKAAQVTIDASSSDSNTDWKTNNSPDTVFISDTVGYVFYQDFSDDCSYAKTTDGGSTWGTPVNIHLANCAHVAVWYDRWTPGDTTGTLIHIATLDLVTDDVYYNTLNTASSDALALVNSAPMNVSTDMTNSFGTAASRLTITKATDGKLYIGVLDNGTLGDQPWVKRCASSCTTTQSNWTDTGLSTTMASGNDELALMPLPSGNILAVAFSNVPDDIISNVYTQSSNTWGGSFTTVDAAAPRISGYDGHMGLTLNKSTNDIYIAYVADNVTLGTDDDIRTAKYSSGSWTNTTAVLSNNARGITNAKLALDENTGDVYCIYSVQATAGTATTGEMYYKKSTDGMATWGAESSIINTAAQADIWGARVNIMSNERIYVTWHDINGLNADKLDGNTVIDLTANAVPAAPTLSAPANAATGVSTTPLFQLRTTDAESNYLRYKIDVCSTSNCSSVVRTIDQTASQTGWSGQDQQTSTAYTGNSVLTSSTVANHTYQTPALSAGTQYWWRAYAIDPGGSNTFSSASSISSFTTAGSNTAPGAPTLSLPANAATGVNILPQFQLSATDSQGDYLRYKIEVCSTSNCSSVAYTIDQTASQTGWSSQDAQTSTAYASGTTAVHTMTINLSAGTQYWWRAYAIDPGGTNTFGTASSISTFTTAAAASSVQLNGGTELRGGTQFFN